MAAAVMPSQSEFHRKKGNEIIRNINTLAPVLHEDRLLNAIKCYNQALYWSKTTNEKMSALKNLGVTSAMLAKCVEISLEKILYHKEQGIGHFSAALAANDGQFHSKSWVSDVEKKLYDLTTGYLLVLHDCSENTREKKLIQLCPSVADVVKSRCYIDMNKMYFGRALNYLEKKDFRRSLHLFGECYTPLQEATRFLKVAFKDDNSVTSEIIQDQDDQVHVTESAAKALQSIQIGDEVQARAIFNSDELSMELMWDAVDHYQQAIVYSSIYSDLESEAIAATRIGLVYMKVFKMAEKGYTRLKHAFDLAESMKPRYFAEADWYKKCMEAMKEHQDEKQKKEEAERAKSRAPHLEKLKDVLEVIRQKCEKSPYDLLKHVYEKHPPKNNNKLPDDINPKNLKKVLRDASCHYHPDKNSAEEHGMEWFVLADEICKYINVHYERQKDMS